MSDVQPARRDLAATLQALYDSEINVAVGWTWDGGIDFMFAAFPYIQSVGKDDWHRVEKIGELADAIHAEAVKKFPQSRYATTQV